MDDGRVILRASEPIFPVADVVATVRYYRDVLGFREEWLWGDPPDFGGVRWGRVGAMFALRSGSDTPSGGQWHSFFVEGIDDLYRLHTQMGATIQSPLGLKPWGLREYTVRDLDGHFLRFGQRGSDRSATAGRGPATGVSIVERLPTLGEYRRLLDAVGWGGREDRALAALSGAHSGVVALDGDRAVGMGMIVGDGSTFAYLRDVIVVPGWQGRGVGSRVVGGLMAILRRSDPKGLLVTLFTGQNLAEFYERFGFAGPERLYGMSLNLVRGRADREIAGEESP